MLVVLYEGDPSDPLSQRVRLVRASSIEDARAQHPKAFMVARYERPVRQEPADLSRLKRGVSLQDLIYRQSGV